MPTRLVRIEWRGCVVDLYSFFVANLGQLTEFNAAGEETRSLPLAEPNKIWQHVSIPSSVLDIRLMVPGLAACA